MSSATPIEPSGSAQGSLALDDAGFSALYRASAQDLVVFFARRTYDAEAAADLMAETFAKAYLGRRRFRGSNEEEARAWLFGIARRRFAMYVRRGKAERRALRRLGLERPQLVEGSMRGSSSSRTSTRCEGRWPSIWAGWLRRNARRSSCESCESFPTRMWRIGSESANRRPERVYRAHFERWDRRSTGWQRHKGDQDA